jgi:site-specific DNA-methyltransferase (adenine-specific)
VTDQEAVLFVKEYAEKYIGKPLSQMSEGEKDEVLVCFKEKDECYLFGRIYPFDEEGESLLNDGVIFQVECNGDIEDYSNYNQALQVYYSYAYNGIDSYVNRIINEDAVEGMEKLYSEFGECIDLCITDPPYKITSRGTVGKNAKQKPQGMLTRNDGKVFNNNSLEPNDYIPLIYKLLKPESHFYLFTNVINLHNMIKVALNTGFKLHNILIWEKNNCTPSQFYMKNCEYILFFRKGKAKWINNIGTKTVVKIDNVKNKSHPTEKPIDLLKMYIENSCKVDDIVLDPFMGSGSLAEACNITDRYFIGWEIDEEYHSKAESRTKGVNK